MDVKSGQSSILEQAVAIGKGSPEFDSNRNRPAVLKVDEEDIFICMLDIRKMNTSLMSSGIMKDKLYHSTF